MTGILLHQCMFSRCSEAKWIIWYLVIFLLKVFILNLFYACECYLHAFMCTRQVPGAYGGQKMVSGPPELEL